MVELLIHLFDLMGQSLLDLVEESIRTGHITRAINTTFLALIPKSSCLRSFLKFRSISLCNITFTLISMVIATHIMKTLSIHVSQEKFKILNNFRVFYAIVMVQECIHSIHTNKLEFVVMKVDLQKVCYYVDWSFLPLILSKIGLVVHNVEWIMTCVSSVYML